MEDATAEKTSVKEKSIASTEGSVVPDRAAWGSPIEFVLSCLNYAVGLGNVWRFPYLVYRNGGGAFLIPYIIMLFTMGLPIFFLELVVGQYSGLGPNTAFKRMAPIFHGLGYCALVVITLITIYYQVIVGWTLFYTYASFDSELGWGHCNHDFNTPRCFSQKANLACEATNQANDSTTFQTFYNNSCEYMVDVCGHFNLDVKDERTCMNGTGEYPLMTLLKRVLASEEYYNDYAMGIRGATWEHWGSLRWEMVLCLFIAWVIAYLCVIKGVASMGKVVYFTSIFPYVVLTALLIRGATLPGAYEGIKFYITPQWEYLAQASVWGDAASQTFYALGIGCGSLVTLSSYNQFGNNCHRDALFVGIVNMLTSIYAGFVVFSILGFMANQLGVPVADVVQSGPGLAFIAYPEAVIQMPVSQLWAVLFFLMLFILGLGSQFGGIEAINTVIIDRWPKLRKYNYLVTAGTCTTCFLLAIPMCFQGGVFLFTVMDWNTAAWGIMIIGLLEVFVVAWVYGVDRFLGNVVEMSIKLPKFGIYYWKYLWMFVAPLFLIGILGFTLYDYTPAYYGDIVFPHSVDVMGWLIAACSLVPLPLFAIHEIYKQSKKEKGDWKDLFRSSRSWGPVGSLQKPLRLSTALKIYDNVAFETEGDANLKKASSARASTTAASNNNDGDVTTAAEESREPPRSSLGVDNDAFIDDTFKCVDNCFNEIERGTESSH